MEQTRKGTEVHANGSIMNWKWIGDMRKINEEWIWILSEMLYNGPIEKMEF